MPGATAEELNRIEQRVIAGAGRGITLRSRLAILTILVLGVILSMSGAALGVSAISGGGSAGVAQYGGGGSAGDDDQGGEEGDDDDDDAEAARQVTVRRGGGGGLPLTGYAAIPALLAGVGMLGSGIALNRRSKSL